MGPILGAGMSLAINDIDLLRRSFKKLYGDGGAYIITAYLFFEFVPIKQASAELLNRTKPDLRDVLIAFFWRGCLGYC